MLGSKALFKPSFCAKHADEILKLFCQKTNCYDCTIVDHCSHKYNFVADAVEGERKAISERMSVNINQRSTKVKNRKFSKKFTK